MKTLVKLIAVALLLSGTAGSCAVAYIVGYSEGLGNRSQTIEPPPAAFELIPVDPQNVTLGVVA